MLRYVVKPAVFVALMMVPFTLAQACTLSPDYRVPTTMQLVRSADAIVLARVRDFDVSPVGQSLIPETVLDVENVIAGSDAPNQVRVRGGMPDESSRVRRGERARHSDPEELVHVNPDASFGYCNRYIFERGMLLLLFLDRGEDGSYSVINFPYARTLEDVPDANALWVRAVRFYASVAPLGRHQRRRAMERERDRLQATGDRLDAILARDIDRQLSFRYPVPRG